MSDVLTRLILLLAGLLAGASSSAILAEPVGGQEPVPIEAGLAPTGLLYAPGPDVLHYYDFELALSEGDESFLGRARLRLALVEPLPEAIVLDLTGLAVDAVRIDGRDVEFELSSGQLRIARPTQRTAGELTLDILYRGTPDDGLILRNTLHGRPAVFADNWPNRARFWLPTVDHPSDKATVRFTVHAPAAWEVVANGPLLVQEPFVTRGGRPRRRRGPNDLDLGDRGTDLALQHGDRRHRVRGRDRRHRGVRSGTCGGSG